MSDKKVYGYVVLHKETRERFPTKKSCYNSRAAASSGFNLITVRFAAWESYTLARAGLSHLKGVAMKDQDEYAVFELVVNE